MSGDRDRPGRCGRRLADHIFPVLYNSYRSIQVRSERGFGFKRVAGRASALYFVQFRSRAYEPKRKWLQR